MCMILLKMYNFALASKPVTDSDCFTQAVNNALTGREMRKVLIVNAAELVPYPGGTFEFGGAHVS